VLGLIALAFRSFWLTEAPETNLNPRPLDLPVVDMQVDSMDDVERAMRDKPLPAAIDMKLPPFDEDDHIRGERFADFSIVEYSNYGNKLAALLHPDLLAMANAGEINWVARHFPLDEKHDMAAQAAECAYFQGGDHAKFWAYHDAAFPLQDPTLEQLVSLASSQGLDAVAFRTCLENDFTRDHVLRDLQDGMLDAKVQVSPSYVVVNNLTGELRLVEGVNTIGYLMRVVDDIR
jgi:protein-disulfide isomerase